MGSTTYQLFGGLILDQLKNSKSLSLIARKRVSPFFYRKKKVFKMCFKQMDGWMDG